MHIRRGIVAGVLGLSAGVLVPFIAVTLAERRDLAWWSNYGSGVLVGCATYLSLAAVATYLPNSSHRFAGTLAELFILGVPLTWAAKLLHLTPLRDKEHAGSPLHWTEFVALVLPPLLIAAVLTWRRCQPDTISEDRHGTRHG